MKRFLLFLFLVLLLVALPIRVTLRGQEITCAEADTITDSYSPWGMDTVYWEVIKVDSFRDWGVSTVDRQGNIVGVYNHLYTWHRRAARWMCRVDTILITDEEHYCIDFAGWSPYRHDTTWIPLAPVFIDTTGKRNSGDVILPIIDFSGGLNTRFPELPKATLDWGRIDSVIQEAVDRAYRKRNNQEGK